MDDVAREFVDSLEKEIRDIYEKIKLETNKIKNKIKFKKDTKNQEDR